MKGKAQIDSLPPRRQAAWLKIGPKIRNGSVVILLQAGIRPNPALKGVAYVLDLAKTQDQRQALELVYAGQSFARPIVTPPGVPPAILATLRSAYDAALKDPTLRAEARQQKLELDPVSAEECASILAKAYATPKPIVQRIAAIMSAKTSVSKVP